MALVDGRLAAEAEMSAVVVDRDPEGPHTGAFVV
jgi:hypothetical protein